jgi:hypothetical protein
MKMTNLGEDDLDLGDKSQPGNPPTRKKRTKVERKD